MKTYYVDKILSVGTTYDMPSNLCWRIQKIGTDSTSTLSISVGGRDTLAIDSDVAPIHANDSNMLGPIDLGDLWIAIPPDEVFSFSGSPGSKVRVIGWAYKLEYNEPAPQDIKDRFERQSTEYVKLVSNSVSLGIDVPWSAGDTITLLTLQPGAYERYVLDGYMGIKVENATISEGQVSVLFALDEIEHEYYVPTNAYAGFDITAFPLPPTSSTEYSPFTMANIPYVVEKEHTFTVKAKNVSGSNITPTAGTSITITTKAVAKYFRL